MKKIYILLLGLIIFTSCDREEWLDIKPKGVVIPTKVNDYRLLLDQVSTRFGAISPVLTGAYSNTDLLSDDFVIADDLTDRFGVEDLRTYTWENNIFDITEEDDDWARLYGQIYVTNIVIEEVLDADGKLEEKKQLEAEARIHRAFAYFSLANMYGLHYNPATASSNLAVPLRLNSDLEGVDFSRASVQEIYDFIVDEVETSIADLPDIFQENTFKHRPTKLSANILLARIYLYMAEYEKAREAANNALAIYNVLSDYNTYGLRFSVLNVPRNFDDPEVAWNKNANTYNMRILTDELLNLHDQDDLRLTKYAQISIFFGIQKPGLALGYHYFSGHKANGFTTAEALLIRAECNARLGQPGLAVNDLNTLREKRFATGTYTPITSTDADEVLDLVKLERRIEFVGGGLRFFDIKRYNEFDNANISITHTLAGESHTLAPGDKNWALPVAQIYILSNPEIGENVRD